jgi:hypothetical protein
MPRAGFIYIILKYSVPAAKKVENFSNTNINCLMLFREVTDIYSESYTEHMLCYRLIKQVTHLAVPWHRRLVVGDDRCTSLHEQLEIDPGAHPRSYAMIPMFLSP